MNRLTNNISQKHLRSLAVKHGMQNATAGEKIDSPLVKVNANGTVTCVICRSNLKSASVWKVHMNSKAHKNNVREAKELKDKILNAKPTATSTPQVQPTVPKATNTTVIPAQRTPNEVKASANAATILTQTKNTGKVGASGNTHVAGDPLPEEFFDASAQEVKARAAESRDEEWEQFQKEIQEVSRVSHEIFVADQKNVAVEKEIVEINEQIHHWSKVLDMEEKKNKLNQILGKKPQNKVEEDEDVSSEGEDFDEFTDWRAKGFK